MEEGLDLNVSLAVKNTYTANNLNEKSSNKPVKFFLLLILIISILIPLLLVLFRTNIENLQYESSIPKQEELSVRHKRLNAEQIAETASSYKNTQNNNVYDDDIFIHNPKILWKHSGIGFLPIIYNNRIYVGNSINGDYISVLSLADGIKLKTFNGSNNHPLAGGLYGLYGTKCGIHGFDYQVCSIDPDSGKVLWRFRTREVEQVNAESIAHFFARQTSDVKIFNSIAYFTAEDNYLYALNAITGEKIWEFTDEPYDVGYFYAPMKRFAIDDNSLFVYSGKGKLYALDAISGKQIWNTSINQSEEWPSLHPVVGGGKILLPLFNGTLLAFDEKTGQKKWEYTFHKTRKIREFSSSYISEPVIDKNSVYISDNTGYLYELDMNDGKEINKIYLGDYRLSNPVVTQDQIFILSTDKNLSESIGIFDTEDGILSTVPKSVLFAIDKRSFKQKWFLELDATCSSSCSADPVRFLTIYQDKLLVPAGTSLYLIGDTK